jgi:hypothetical protein
MLDKILAGKAVAVTPFIDEIDEGMGGGSTPQDLEDDVPAHLPAVHAAARGSDAFAAMASQARALLANQTASPDVVFNQTIDAALSGTARGGSPRRRHGGPVEPREVAGVLQGALRRREQLHVRLRRQLHAETIKPLVETYLASLPATRARETWRDLGIVRRPASSRRRSRRASRPRARWRSSSPAVRVRRCAQAGASAMTLVLQSRLFDTHPPGARRHLQHHATPARRSSPAGVHGADRLDVRSGATATLVQRVFEEIEFVRSTRSRRPDGAHPRALLRGVRGEQPGQPVPAQPDSRGSTRKARRPTSPPRSTCPIDCRLTGEQIEQAAQTYLNAQNYVKVTLVPEKK